MDTISLLSAIEISDLMRRTAVKITPVKMKVDLNSSDYKTHHSLTTQFGDVPAYYAWETKYVDVSSVHYMDESLDELM